MNLLWGIKPIRCNSFGEDPEFIEEICRWGTEHANLRSGDQVVFVTGTGVVKRAHNQLIVRSVE
jgi:pyruvate kinase